jgi:hypothetical protein
MRRFRSVPILLLSLSSPSVWAPGTFCNTTFGAGIRVAPNLQSVLEISKDLAEIPLVGNLERWLSVVAILLGPLVSGALLNGSLAKCVGGDGDEQDGGGSRRHFRCSSLFPNSSLFTPEGLQ